MRTMFSGPGSGKTYQAIQEAAAAQDEGADCVLFVIPSAEYLDYMFDTMCEHLDMSRVEVITAQGVLSRPPHRRHLKKVKRGFRTKTVLEPEYAIIDNADMIPFGKYGQVLDRLGDTVRFITGRSIPGTWNKDTTPGVKS